MKVSIIAPTRFLDSLVTDDYHLVLSYLVREDHEYADFYRRASARGDWTILDNSAHEFGAGEKLEKLWEVACEIRAREVVLPDRLFFGDDTVESSLEALTFFRKHLPNTHLMGVPQGRTFGEYDFCLRRLLGMGVDTIGISKDYEVWPGGLLELVERVRKYEPQIDIHMLGWGRNSTQLFDLGSNHDLDIRGVDSAKPLVYALAGIPLNPAGHAQPPYPRRLSNFFESTSLDLDLARYNIQVFKSVAQGMTSNGM